MDIQDWALLSVCYLSGMIASQTFGTDWPGTIGCFVNWAVITAIFYGCKRWKIVPRSKTE